MSDGGYKIRDQGAIHFLTFAVVDWVDVFTRKLFCDVVVDSLKFCQEERGLLIHSWIIMSNHLHLLSSARDQNLSDLLRDFKKFTSREIIKAIEKNPKESRKDWMLQIFKNHGAANSRNALNQFWQQDNCPQICYTTDFTFQKLNYIHQNPVKAGFVKNAEDYIYSSANAYKTRQQIGPIEISFL
jgi:putative transposase